MFKKTKIRSILELLDQDLSENEIAKSLHVSRNTVKSVREAFEQSGLKKNLSRQPEHGDENYRVSVKRPSMQQISCLMIIMLQKKIENVYSGRRVVRYPSPVFLKKMDC